MKKNILITGATGNLGNASVERFYKDGYQVIVVVTPGRASLFADEKSVDVFEADLTNESETATVVEEIIRKYKTIDAALLLVGGFAAGGIKEATGESISKMFALNFETAYYCARPLFLHMTTQEQGGKIVLVGSRPALVAKDGRKNLSYALSKSLLFKLADFLNVEGEASNVITSVIVPGTIDTPVNRQAMPGSNFDNWVTPEEIADTIALLISGKARAWRETVIKIYGNS
jgi:NAD(P)-dependent dehydrogenase (short-subunit alcohol dehydrogenase family)